MTLMVPGALKILESEAFLCNGKGGDELMEGQSKTPHIKALAWDRRL